MMEFLGQVFNYAVVGSFWGIVGLICWCIFELIRSAFLYACRGVQKIRAVYERH